MTASSEVQAPAVLPGGTRARRRADLLDFRAQFRRHLLHQQAHHAASVEELASHAPQLASDGMPVLLDRLGSALGRQQLPREVVRELMAELHAAALKRGLAKSGAAISASAVRFQARNVRSLA